MKKITYTLTSLLLFFSVSIYAQNLKLSYNEEDVSNAEINIEGNADEDLKVVINITNTSDTEIQIKIRKRVIEDIAGSVNTFCLGECFSPSVEVSPNPFSIGPEQTTTSNDFYVEFFPQGNIGSAKITYDVFNVSNEEDKVIVTLNFTIQEPTWINTLGNNIGMSAFPNPLTSNEVRINYTFQTDLTNVKVTVRNILGMLVAQKEISNKSGAIDFNLNNLPNGLYLYSIESGGKKIITKKLMINR